MLCRSPQGGYLRSAFPFPEVSLQLSRRVGLLRADQGPSAEPCRVLKRSRAERMLRSLTPAGHPRYIPLSACLIQEVSTEMLAKLSLPLAILCKRLNWDEGLLIYYPVPDQSSYPHGFRA